jgi:hypothetical protein
MMVVRTAAKSFGCSDLATLRGVVELGFEVAQELDGICRGDV